MCEVLRCSGVDDIVHTQTRDVQMISWAMMWVDVCVRRGMGSGCVVFDIDRTLIDDDEKVIRSTRRLYNHCRARKVACRIVTARVDCDAVRAETCDALRCAGYATFSSLHMMSPMSARESMRDLSEYKHQARQHISQTCGPILLSVGDMWHDVLRLASTPRSTLDMCESLHGPCIVQGCLPDGAIGVKLDGEGGVG